MLRLAARAVERIDTAVHYPTPGRFRAALRTANACAEELRRAPLARSLKLRAQRSLRLQLALLEHLAAGRAAVRVLH